MERWLSERLTKILDFQVPNDLIQYIISINNHSDLNDYMGTLLDFENSEHKIFFQELLKKKFSDFSNSLPKQQKKKISKNKPQIDFVTVNTQKNNIQSSDKDSKSKKKAKYVNLYSQEGKNAQVVLLKGRHHCDCQASKHELINNCLQCGRVVCKQEGSGPCLFCGNVVCTVEEQNQINSKSKAGQKLIETLLERNRPKGWEAAISHRNRLLDFDRTSEKRTRVTDDDSDYFNVNSVWLSSNERERLEKYQQALRDKKHASRLHKKMTFDFAGRQVVEDKTIDYEPDEEKVREITHGSSDGTSINSNTFINQNLYVSDSGDRDVAPGVNASVLQFDPSVAEQNYSLAARSSVTPSVASRIQDAELLEMSDSGKCLSMHQPWASLLVEGIKLHEGRTWYTSHRGRLWIASTAKPPDQEIIRAIENRYRVLYPGKKFNFPTFYPTGCLLGCVNVDDCLPQEEYDKKYPDGESDSPYVFICSNPVSLRLRFPVKGQHKIYTLDKTIHQAAVKSLQRMAKIQAEEANAG